MQQQRVAAIHDISGFGRCSLTVALPIISAAGIEVAVMPTAVLSSHTGGLEGYTYRDLTEDLRPFARHWKKLGLEFDAIYSGFLGSIEQIEIVEEFIEDFKKEGCLILVDPAMADSGRMYSVFDMDFALEMRRLCAMADIICPNITEAAFLLEKEYIAGPHTKEYIEELLKGLGELGPCEVVLTGVMFDRDHLGAATYDKQSGEISYAFSDIVEGTFHGTGDVFASAMLAAHLKGKSLAQSTKIAVDYTVSGIKLTKAAGTDLRYGINFEAGIGKLIEMIEL
ncbi:MAG: pyridoxamine kinase [Clostridiales bacterium]|nr:pyridoxamine kinase [Clostridiales bacterium]